ncbi:unnamed protein product [Amaranthus hypochondriacus]
MWRSVRKSSERGSGAFHSNFQIFKFKQPAVLLKDSNGWFEAPPVLSAFRQSPSKHSNLFVRGLPPVRHITYLGPWFIFRCRKSC